MTLEALGGPAIAAAGASVRFPLERYAVMGVVEVFAGLPRHWRLLRRLERELRAGRYDLMVLIDYPGFNLRLAEAAQRSGVRVLYYIAPKYWASGTGRVPRLGRAVNRLAAILPFEPEFFARYGVTAEFVGHPLLDQPAPPSRAAARRRLGIADGERVLALFPGSRAQELTRMWPAFRDAARLLQAAGACGRVLVAARPGAHYAGADGWVLPPGDPATILAAADAALVKSGTATLEAALAEVPMVVAYRLHPLTAILARRALTVPWISLVNLIAGRGVVAELTQDGATPSALAAAVTPLFDPDGSAARSQRAAFRELRQQLGEPGAARRVAEMAAELLR